MTWNLTAHQRVHAAKAILSLILLSLAGCAIPFARKEADSLNEPAPAKASGKELSPQKAAQACLQTAEELERKGHYREASQLYEKARQKAPQAIAYSRRLAVLYERMGDNPRALAEYERAAQEHPRDADLLNDFGYFHYRAGQFEAAEGRLRAALAINPGHARAQMNLAMTLAERGRLAESYELFSQRVGPAAAHSNLGAILARQGRHDEAVDAFHRALALDPSLGPPRAFLAYYDAKRRDSLAARP